MEATLERIKPQVADILDNVSQQAVIDAAIIRELITQTKPNEWVVKEGQRVVSGAMGFQRVQTFRDVRYTMDISPFYKKASDPQVSEETFQVRYLGALKKLLKWKSADGDDTFTVEFKQDGDGIMSCEAIYVYTVQ